MSTSGWAKETNCVAPLDNSAGYGIGVFQITDPMIYSSLFYRTVWPAY